MKRVLSVLAASLWLAGCGGGGGGTATGSGADLASNNSSANLHPTPNSLKAEDPLEETFAQVGNITVRDPAKGPFSILGTVSGLTSEGLVLSNRWAKIDVSPKSSAFVFMRAVPANSGYSVIVEQQPINPSQECKIANGNGTATTTVSNLAVTCNLSAKFAFVSQKNATDGSIDTYRFDESSGSLGLKLASSVFLTPDASIAVPGHILRHPMKSVIYVETNVGKSIIPFAVGESDGKLTRLRGADYANPASSPILNSAGTRLYTLMDGGRTLVRQELGTKGEFSDDNGYSSLSAPVLKIKLSKDNQSIYTLSATGSFATFAFDKAGDLGSKTAAIGGMTGATDFVISPDAKFAYVSMINSNSIARISLKENGEAVSSGLMTFGSNIIGLQSLQFDPTGNFLFGFDSTKAAVVAFKVDAATGVLEFKSSTPVDANSSPELTFDPLGKFVYVTAQNTTGFVRGFSINASTGALTELPLPKTGFESAHALRLY